MAIAIEETVFVPTPIRRPSAVLTPLGEAVRLAYRLSRALADIGPAQRREVLEIVAAEVTS